MSDLGDIALWHLPDDAPPTLQSQAHVDRGRTLTFGDENTLVTESGDSVRIFRLDASGLRGTMPSELSTSEISAMSANAELHMIVLGDTTGHLTLIDIRSSQMLDHASICRGAVNRIVTLASRGMIAYTCQDGDVGTWTIPSKSSKVHGHLDGGASAIAASADDRYLVAGGNAGAFFIHDFATGNSKRYLGHTSRIIAASPPTPEFPYSVSADSHGGTRVWRRPDARIEPVITTTTRMFHAAQLESNGAMIAIGDSKLVSWHMQDGTAGQSDGHIPAHAGLTVSTTRAEAMFFGRDDELELWTFAGRPTSRTLRTGHGAVKQAAYRFDGTAFIAACQDGTLVEWSNGGARSRSLGTINEPIDFWSGLRNSDSVIVGGVSGVMWVLDPGGKKYLGLAPMPSSIAVSSPDGRWLAISDPRGIVRLYDLSTRVVLTFRSPHESSAWMQFSPDSSKLAVATNSTISLVTMPGARAESTVHGDRQWSWSDAELAVRDVSFSPDNEWFVATGDHGDMWFNRRGESRWIYLSTGANRILWNRFSADSSHFIATDAGGRALSIDMRASPFTGRQE